MKWQPFIVPIACLLTMGGAAAPTAHWKRLPDTPGGVGFAAMYLGASNGVLLAGGGANFPPKTDGSESIKTWHDAVYALRPGREAWEEVGRLPRAGAYGVTGHWAGRVVCAGGSDASGPFANAWMMAWQDGRLEVEPLPDLPVALDMACGGVVRDTLYVVSGYGAEVPEENRMYALDLSRPAAERKWVALPWPAEAPGRRLAVSATANGKLYLFGGLVANAPAGSNPHLRDAYAYDPESGWKRIADLPRGVTGGATSAMVTKGGRIGIWGGLDAPWAELRKTMSTFESDLVIYNPTADRWERIAAGPPEKLGLPSRLTATAAEWQGGFVVVGGETAPRTRTSTTAWVQLP